MEEKIRKTMQEKIKNKAVNIGLNSVLRAAKNGELEFIIYAINANNGIRDKLSQSGVQTYEYDGDNEALSIACGKSFNISVLGIKK